MENGYGIVNVAFEFTDIGEEFYEFRTDLGARSTIDSPKTYPLPPRAPCDRNNPEGRNQ